MKLALIDDDENDLADATDYITGYILKNHGELSYNLKTSSYLNPREFLSDLRTERFDLIVLDIFMKEMNGIQVAHAIRELDRECNIIFLTSSDAFMLDGYLVFASGYFIKPLDEHAAEFERTFEYIYPKLMAKHLELRVPVIKGADVDIPYSNIFFVDINEKHKLRVSTRTQQFISSMSYEDCQKWLLTDKRFLECHYRIIVNMDRIAEMLDEDFLLDDGRKVPISHRKRKEANRRYMQYLAHKGE